VSTGPQATRADGVVRPHVGCLPYAALPLSLRRAAALPTKNPQCVDHRSPNKIEACPLVPNKSAVSSGPGPWGDPSQRCMSKTRSPDRQTNDLPSQVKQESKPQESKPQESKPDMCSQGGVFDAVELDRQASPRTLEGRTATGRRTRLKHRFAFRLDWPRGSGALANGESACRSPV
jgi:hypothetical protein